MRRSSFEKFEWEEKYRMIEEDIVDRMRRSEIIRRRVKRIQDKCR